MSDLKDQLLDAILMHVPFDGWSDEAFRAAATDLGQDIAAARAAVPRGALGLAIAYHKRGDAAMLEKLAAADMTGLRFRDKIALAVRLRLESVEDKEAVRRGTTLFSLPHLAPEGAKLIWGTCDAIWEALGDSSDDVNWYTKRATLSGVYSATVLYWLGDDSPDHQASWAFLERRIDNVMQIEEIKAKVRNSPVLSRLMAGPTWLTSHIKAPARSVPEDLPGRWTAPRG